MDTVQKHYRTFREQSLHYFRRPHHELPSGPIVSPAAWRGAEIRGSEEEWRFALTPSDIAELEHALLEIEASDTCLEQVDRASAELPGLASRLTKWRQCLATGRGLVVVSGLPVDRWGETRSALAFWLLGHHLGVPGAQNAEGELLGHIIDYGEQSDSPNVRLYRTTSEIGFHCDAADVVGLLCLRPAPSGGQSRIASSVAIFNAILAEDSNLAQRLFEPFAVDRRDEEPAGQPRFFEIPAARHDEAGTLRTFYHSEYFRSVSRLPEVGPLPERTLALLDRYDALAASPDFHLDMNLAAGDMQFISNHTVVHARTLYEDDEAPEKKRHLLRLWLSI